MRVAVLNRARDSHPGGDLIHIDLLTRHLAKLGVQRDYIDGHWTSCDLKSYDLVHLHHVNFDWSLDNWLKVRDSELPYVVTCIFYPENWGVSFAQINQVLSGAHAVAVYSKAERDEMRELTGYGGDVTIIPPGVEERFHAMWDSSRQGVCTAEVRGGEKGSSMIQQACDQVGLPLDVLSGIPHENLHDHYRRYRVFVNASGSERFGLTIIEALAAGCRVLATDKSRGLEWFPGIVSFDPTCVEELGLLVQGAHDEEKWDYRPNIAARRMTWETAAGCWKDVYEEVLS